MNEPRLVITSLPVAPGAIFAHCDLVMDLAEIAASRKGKHALKRSQTLHKAAKELLVRVDQHMGGMNPPIQRVGLSTLGETRSCNVALHTITKIRANRRASANRKAYADAMRSYGLVSYRTASGSVAWE